MIELLVVMLILGILAAIALPLFISQKDRAHDAEAKSTAYSAELAMEACANDNNGYDATACDAEGLHAIEPTLPTGAESPLASARRRRLPDRRRIGDHRKRLLDRPPPRRRQASSPARSPAASPAAAR